MDAVSFDGRLSRGLQRPGSLEGVGVGVARAVAMSRADLGLGGPVLCPLALQGRVTFSWRPRPSYCLQLCRKRVERVVEK